MNNPKNKTSSNRVINTFNESTLHYQLKALYALESNFSTPRVFDKSEEAACAKKAPIKGTEVAVGEVICDVVKGKKVFEIQTATLCALEKKVEWLLGQGFSVTVVHPIAQKLLILTKNESGTVIKKGHSTRARNIFTLFTELTKLYRFIGNPLFKIEVLMAEVTQIRRETPPSLCAKNGRQRWVREWVKVDKVLTKIISRQTFDSVESLLSLFPKGVFTKKELGAKNKRDSSCALFVAKKLGRLERCSRSSYKIIEEKRKE